MALRRFPLLAKSLALAGVMIALALALQSVSGVVAEREGRLREAERSVAASLASAQTLLGPVIERDCSEIVGHRGRRGQGHARLVTERREFTLRATPASLEMNGDVAIEPRYRGIFKVNAYLLKTRLVATWNDGSALLPQAQHLGSRLQCDAPLDVRGAQRFARRAQRDDADRRRGRAGAPRHAAGRPSARLSRRGRGVVRRLAARRFAPRWRSSWSARASSRSRRSANARA